MKTATILLGTLCLLISLDFSFGIINKHYCPKTYTVRARYRERYCYARSWWFRCLYRWRTRYRFVIRTNSRACCDGWKGSYCHIPTRTPRNLPRVGMFYSVWHTEAFHAQDYVRNVSRNQYSMEDLIRGKDGINFHDIYENAGVPGKFSFYWHVEPKDGYYCIYRKRPEEVKGHMPDCPNIRETLKRHATQLTAAGIDYIVVDATNIAQKNSQSDTLNYRPFEVLVEEWHQLRSEGVVTPDVVIWFPVWVGGDAYKWAMDNVYSRAEYDDMILKDHNTGKKVVHIVGRGDIDDNIVTELQTVYNCTVIYNWALKPPSDYESGYWTWMQPCRGPNEGYSSTIIGRDCPITVTRNSPLGRMVPVAKSYQLSYASSPWLAAGVRRGLTFKKQMEKALNERPDHLFISAWNEHIAQPQSNPYDGITNTPWMMGLEHAVTHTSPYTGGHAKPLWVDLYGEEYSRDFEPTVHAGDSLYRLLQSCVRVFRSGATTCNNPEEECCNTVEHQRNVWSFIHPGTQDHILAHSTTERDALVKGGWNEECTRFDGGDFIWCVDKTKFDVTKGPFIVFTEGGENRVALYRCLIETTPQHHFFSEFADCEGHTVEYLIGYLSTIKTSETPRSLTRCYDTDLRQHFHSLDHDCPPNTNAENMMGYVN